jgi:hypothetical protein
MVVVDSDHKVVGMITRTDLTESRLESHWHREVSSMISPSPSPPPCPCPDLLLPQGHNLQKFINIDHLPAAVVPRDLITIDEESQAEEMEDEKRT